MGKKIKISLAALIFLIAVVVLLQFQAKRIIIKLVEANASDRISVKIGRTNIHLLESSIALRDVAIVVKEKDSDGFKKTTINKAFLDVASLFDFFLGGTLVIEKLECTEGEVTIYKGAGKIDTTHVSFDLGNIFQKIKTDAIRFRIQEISFQDFNFTLLSDSNQIPTQIKHFEFHAHDLFLSADSLMKRKPLVQFSLPGQTIQLPMGTSVGFDSLFFSTMDNAIQVDDLVVITDDHATDNQYKIESEKVRLSHFDFETLYTGGIAIIDSVFLGRSNFSASWLLRDRDENKSNHSGFGSVPKVNIKHLIIKSLAADITLLKDSIKNKFQIDNSFVTIQNFWHKPDSTHKLSMQNFDVVLAKYNTFLGKDNTSISFDTVRLQKHSLSLLNFKINQEDQLHPVLQTTVFELKQVDWYTLLAYKKLVAKHAIALNPTVRTTIKPSHKSESVNHNQVALKSLNDFLDVELFSLKNATAYLKLIAQHADVTLQGGNATIRFDDMLESKNPNEALQALENLSLNTLSVRSQDFTASVDKLFFHNGSSSIGRILVQNGDKLKLSSGDLNVGKMNWNPTQNNLNLSGVGWKTLDVQLTDGSQSKQSNDKTARLPLISVEKLRGKNTHVSYLKNDVRLSTILYQLNLETLHLGDTLRITGIDIKGGKSEFQSGIGAGSINTFLFTDQGGEFSDVRINRVQDSLTSSIGQIKFQANVQGLAQKKGSINQLALKDMKSSFSKRDGLQWTKLHLENDLTVNDIRFVENKLTIGSFWLEAGPIEFKKEKKISKDEESSVGTSKGNVRKIRIGIDSLLKASDTANHIRSRVVTTKKSDDPIQSTILKSGKGGISLSLSQIETFVVDSSTQVTAKVNSIKLHQVNLTQKNMSAQIATGSIDHIVLHSNHFNTPWEMIRDNYTTAAIHNLKARIETDGNFIQFDRLDYDPQLMSGQIENMEFRPIRERQEFLDASFYQTNFIHTKISSITFQNFYPKKLVHDSIIHVGHIQVNAPDLDIHRDKTHPFFSSSIKLLPTNAIQKLGLKFKVDTIKIGEGKIRYTEKSQITGQEGSIHFTSLNGLVRNVKNTELGDNDSLYIRASTRFLDSAKVNLRVRESYRDTLGSFVMTTQVSPFHTSILNASLIPMVSVKFESGFVDTLHMRAIGREYLSLGSMQFLYSDLRVNFLNKDDTSKHSVKNILLKFAANSFVIRTNNTKRIGKVFFERDRYRAVFQYWIKMILSGVTTSVGAKSNKKQIKKYMKELDQKKLPPIQDVSDNF